VLHDSITATAWLPGSLSGVPAVSAPVLAGMASPLPTDFKTISRLTETALGRFQVISFFAITV
jgi:hypothetical protein